MTKSEIIDMLMRCVKKSNAAIEVSSVLQSDGLWSDEARAGNVIDTDKFLQALEAEKETL